MGEEKSREKGKEEARRDREKVRAQVAEIYIYTSQRRAAHKSGESEESNSIGNEIRFSRDKRRCRRPPPSLGAISRKGFRSEKSIYVYI